MSKECKTEKPPVDEAVQKVVDTHLLNIEEIVLSTLAECLAADISFYDVGYIPRRIIQTVEEAVPDIDFENTELEALMKEHFTAKAKKLCELVNIDIFDEKTREFKCEPIVHSVIKNIASPDFIGKDKEWFDSYIKESNRMFVVELLKHLFEATFSKLDFSLEQSYKQAEKKLFGVEKTKLSLKKLDAVLKSK